MQSRIYLLLLLFCALKTTAQNSLVSKWPQGITYEIFVQSFADSNGDGIGDIRGMTAKLDYLKSLGVEGIWLMPINPAPSYHKYDVVDYYGIHPDYGAMEDFKNFLAAAHQRNIRVVMDLVLNHSSNHHPWFLAAKNNPESPFRDFYVWTHQDDPQTKKPVRYTGADSDNSRHWHRADSSDHLYYGFFSGSMPDLNFDNSRLRAEIFKIGRFWLQEVGVDGFRLDAARHIFPDHRAHDSQKWWEYFRSEMQKVKKDVYIVGEVWATAPEVGPYLNGIPALFNFDLGYAITKAVNTGRADSLTHKLHQTWTFYQSINPDFVDAIFLTNHDQNRIMSAVNGNTQKARLAAAILFTLPGSPYIYYGEELGMKGQKPDEAIREPMLWDVQAKDKERTTWTKPRYNTDSTLAPVARQSKDRSSLLHFYKGWMQLRNHSKALTFGAIQPLAENDNRLLAFVRSTDEESVLVLHNLSSEAVSFSLQQATGHYGKVVYKSGTASIKNGVVQLQPYASVVLGK